MEVGHQHNGVDQLGEGPVPGRGRVGQRLNVGRRDGPGPVGQQLVQLAQGADFGRHGRQTVADPGGVAAVSQEVQAVAVHKVSAGMAAGGHEGQVVAHRGGQRAVTAEQHGVGAQKGGEVGTVLTHHLNINPFYGDAG